MLKRLLKALRKDVTEDDYLQIKTAVVENFMINDLRAQVTYEREMKEDPDRLTETFMREIIMVDCDE